MATFNKFNQFVGDLANGKINLASDALKVMLTNTAPVATNSYYSDVSGTELANGNGYTTGGAAVTTTSDTDASGTVKVILQPVTFTSATGTMGPFRYAVLYDSTPALASAKTLIAYFDYGSSISLNGASGESFQVAFDVVNGAFQIS